MEPCGDDYLTLRLETIGQCKDTKLIAWEAGRGQVHKGHGFLEVSAGAGLSPAPAKASGSGEVMLGRLVRICIFSGCLVALSLPSGAQEIIHALTGTVSAIDSQERTITVLEDNHSTSVFQRAGKTPSSFDKRIAAETTAAGTFDSSGAYTVVFYYGNGDNRQVVALKSLGKGPFSSTEGTVEKFDRSKSISVKDSSGQVQTFDIGAATIAETNMGVVITQKFTANKGDHVRIVSSTESGKPTALFIRDI
jgi:hypothetical protein